MLAAALSWPAHAHGQPVGRPAGATPPMRHEQPKTSATLLDLDAELRAASRYAGWGGAGGAVIGFAYGVREARRITIPGLGVAPVLFDTMAGFTIGLVGGTAVYVVRRMTGQLQSSARP